MKCTSLTEFKGKDVTRGFNPSKCTHTAVTSEHAHTHTHTHVAVGGSVPCSRSHLSCGIEGGESAGHSLPPPTIPAGHETRTWATTANAVFSKASIAIIRSCSTFLMYIYSISCWYSIHWQPYHPAAQGWLPTEAKQGWAWSVPGWETSWEN